MATATEARPAVDRVGDRYINGAWIEEVVERFCADVRDATCYDACADEAGGCDALHDILLSVAGVFDADRARHEREQRRGLGHAHFTEEGNLRRYRADIARGMATLDAFLETHLGHIYRPWRERFIADKAQAQETSTDVG